MSADDMNEQPIYVVLDQRQDGAWREVLVVTDPTVARAVDRLLRGLGDDVRVELVPQPMVPSCRRQLERGRRTARAILGCAARTRRRRTHRAMPLAASRPRRG